MRSFNISKRKKTTGFYQASTVYKNPDLTDKEIMFCRLYVKYLNNTHAAREAGFGSDDKSAGLIGMQLRREPRILEQIQVFAKERLQKTDEDIAFLFDKLFSIASASLTDFAEWQGGRLTFKESSSLKRSESSMIAEIAIGENGAKKLKLHDPLKAIELLGKYFSLADGNFAKGSRAHGNNNILSKALLEMLVERDKQNDN